MKIDLIIIGLNDSKTNLTVDNFEYINMFIRYIHVIVMTRFIVYDCGPKIIAIHSYEYNIL